MIPKPGRIRTVLNLAALALATVLLAAAIEGVASFYLHSTRRNAGLIWMPDSTVEHSTPEFHYVTRVNNMGFRDRDFARSRPAGLRIAVLGDSFTYGWGLPLEQSWPKVLEASLRQNGLPVEVANLGMPGAGPAAYASLARRALGLLRPDVLIVAVLQADDLFQCLDSARQPPAGWRQYLTDASAQVFPGLFQLAGLTRSPQLGVTAQELRDTWSKQVRDFLPGLSSGEQIRFDHLPSEVREMYRHGDLNPGLLYMSMRHGAFLRETSDLERASTKVAVDELTHRLRQIRRAAERSGTHTMVVSVPYRAFVSARDLDAMRQLGFEVDGAMLETENADEGIRRGAASAGLPFRSVLATFRQAARGQECYFPWDGHFNSQGARTFATLLTPEIAAQLR